MTMIDNEMAWTADRTGPEPDEGDLIENAAMHIDEIIEQWSGDFIRPWAITTLLAAVDMAAQRSGLTIEDLSGVADEPVPEGLCTLSLQALAARSDDMALIDRLSRDISDADGQFLYNLVVTLTRMQRHRATLAGLRKAG